MELDAGAPTVNRIDGRGNDHDSLPPRTNGGLAAVLRFQIGLIGTVILIAVMKVTPAQASECAAEMPEMIALANEISDLESLGLVPFDSLVSGRDDPERVARGCVVFTKLLPLYERLEPYANRCWTGNLEIQAEGMIASIERGMARSHAYLAQAGCH